MRPASNCARVIGSARPPSQRVSNDTPIVGPFRLRYTRLPALQTDMPAWFAFSVSATTRKTRPNRSIR